MPDSHNILIIDDHKLFMAGLSTVLDQLNNPVNINELDSARQALTELETSNDYDLILVDLEMPDLSGQEFLQALRSLNIDAKVCVVSGTENTQRIQAAFDAGAVGFIPKTSPVPIMMLGIETVLSGAIFLPEYLWQVINTHVDRPRSNYTPVENKALVTKRQKEILLLIQEGKTNQQIADRLSVTNSTVKFHIAGLFKILDVRTRTECANVARQRKII